MMKKIISLLSVFAMIATMFTTIATADENNYIGWEVVEHTSTKLKANVVINTNQTITYAECTLSLADAASKGLTTVSGEKVTASSFTVSLKGRSKVVAFTYSGSFTGKTVMGTVEFDLTGVKPFTLTEGKPKLLLKGEANADVTSSFTDNYTGYTVAPKADENTVTSFTMTPATAEVKGGEKADFTVAIEGKGNYDGFEYKVVNGEGTDVTADVTTLAGKVITFKAPPASFDDDQTFTITATSTVDSTKTATATVTVAKAGRTGTMVNPADGKTNKTYITDVVEFNTNTTAPEITIKDETGDTRTFKGDWYPTNLKGQGTINVLVIVRYAGETEKTFSIVNE